MGRVFLNVHIQPRASKDEVVGEHGGRIKIRTCAPPVDGKANDHLIGFLATLFGVPRRQVQLISGETGRQKRFEIVDPLFGPLKSRRFWGQSPNNDLPRRIYT